MDLFECFHDPCELFGVVLIVSASLLCFALHVMVFWGFSLILAVSFLGRQAQAVPHPQGDREQHSHHFQHTLETMASSSQILGNNGPPPGATFTSLGDTATTSITTTSSSSTSLPESSTTPTSITGPTVTYFESTWNVPALFKAGAGEVIFYKIPDNVTLSNGAPLDPVLFVLQTSVQAVTGAPPNSSNTWSVAQVPSMFSFPPYLLTACLTFLVNCTDPYCNDMLPGLNAQNPTGITTGTTIDFLVDDTAGTGLNNAEFFFCLANRPEYIDRLECGSYGPFFTINGHTSKPSGPSPRQLPQLSMPPPQMPTTVLSITSYVSMISVSGASITATAPALATSSIMATLSMPVSGTTTATITPSATSFSSPVSAHHGLSTGAKVGIALGALVLVALLLLAALFFLRRKHRSRSSPPEQVMLTRDMHTDSFASNAIIAEKEAASANNIANASPVDDNLPIQRHSAVQPYDSLPAAPYSGDAASVPRRKPTNASAVSRVSGPASPRSLTVSTPPDEYEEYRDQPMPVYGDARHSPRVYSTEERQGVKAPFLSEEGMSAEEVTRLEEEERRIDAAIAEAERSGRR